MGILNVTPDSFSDGGRFDSVESAVDHGLRLIHEGADILDIGGESTRPGATPVSMEEELRRITPVIREIRAASPEIVLSLDTYKGAVAEIALKAGVDILNDVGAGMWDKGMRRVVENVNAGYIVMHSRGMPQTMQKNPEYDDAVAEVMAFLREQRANWAERGLNHERLAIDPGIGFGKSAAHNLELLKYAGSFSALGCPVVWGISRKSFLGKIFEVEEDRRDLATDVVHAWLRKRVPSGMVWRVHDVKRARHLADTGIPLERTPDFDQLLARMDDLK